MPFDFDPPDGYRNIARFPTTPASEGDFRDSMQSLLDQLRDEMNRIGSLGAGVHAMSRQAMINGNFDIAQERTSITNPSNLQYILDQWQVHTGTGAPANITHRQVALTPGELPGSYYFYNVNFDGAGVSPSDFRTAQPMLHGTRYLCGAGKKVTVSFWAKSDVPNKRIGLFLIQNYGTGGNPSAQEFIPGTYVTLTGVWTKYTFTFATNTLAGKIFGTNDDDYLKVNIQYAWDAATQIRVGAPSAETFGQAGNLYFSQFVTNAGDIAIQHQPRTRAEELLLCQFFWEKSYNYADSPGAATTAGAIYGVTEDVTNSGAHYGQVPFKVRKRIAPTVTVYGTGGTINTVNDETADRTLGAGLFATPGETSFLCNYTLNLATSRRRRFHYVADARI